MSLEHQAGRLCRSKQPEALAFSLAHGLTACQSSIFHIVMGTPGGGLALIFLVLVLTLCCSISITVAASRCTWAFARDDAIPGAKLWAKVDKRLGVPVWSLVLVTVVQMLLGLIDLGSTSAFTAFVSVGVQALALAYGIPIAISLFCRRSEVIRAKWNLGQVAGTVVNVVALLWIAFELVLFSMPTALPVTDVSMNYSSVVLVGFGLIAAAWYAAHSRTCRYSTPYQSMTADVPFSLQRAPSFGRAVTVLRSRPHQQGLIFTKNAGLVRKSQGWKQVSIGTCKRILRQGLLSALL